MNDTARDELRASMARMRQKAQGKRTNAQNLSGQVEDMQRRISGLLNDAADLDLGADAIAELLGEEADVEC